jgi:small subunit ribosomal protein S13
MARLSGVDLPREKRLEIALTYVYGIGRTRAAETLAATGVSGDIRVHALAEDDLQKLREWIDANYIRRKIEIGCYQGIRHRRGLPVHGQRTQTNARTRKGKKKTVAGKKKVGKK